MPTRRYFSNFAPRQTLANSIGSSDTTCQIAGSFAGWSTQFPFYATLGYGLSSAEIVSVTNIVGTTATIARAQNGSVAVAHPAGETMDQTAIAQDFDEANAHTSASTGVHGISGHVVGDTDAQTLANKTLASPLVTGNISLPGTLTVAGSTALQAATVAGVLTASGGIAFNAVTDWNTATKTGLYYGPAGTVNAPAAGIGFYGLVMNDSPTGVNTVQVLWPDVATTSTPTSWFPSEYRRSGANLSTSVWVGDNPYFGTTAAIIGTNAPPGTSQLVQAGQETVTTNATAIGVFAWPQAFPNGLISVVLTTQTDSETQLRVVAGGGTTLSQCEFVLRNSTGAGAPNTAVVVSFVAYGW